MFKPYQNGRRQAKFGHLKLIFKKWKVDKQWLEIHMRTRICYGIRGENMSDQVSEISENWMGHMNGY